MLRYCGDARDVLIYIQLGIGVLYGRVAHEHIQCDMSVLPKLDLVTVGGF